MYLQTDVDFRADAFSGIKRSMNLFDEGWNVMGIDVPIVNGYGVINGPPRTFGATLRYR